MRQKQSKLTVPFAQQISARGKLVAERLKKQQEEEERIRKLQEAEQARLDELRRIEEEEERKLEEERERKKQKAREKLERQKKEGTYMTKAQKLKAKLTQQRLDAMKAAGMIPTTTEDEEAPKREKPVYNKKKKGKKGRK